MFYEGSKWSSGSYAVQDPRNEDPFPYLPFYSINVGGSTANTGRSLIVKRNKNK